jgi:hypothetical protein
MNRSLVALYTVTATTRGWREKYHDPKIEFAVFS